MSISEICASGIASVFVPYPYAAADHQRKNARYMLEKNAALYIEDDELNPAKLLNVLTLIIADKTKLAELQNNALSLAKFDGVQRIVEQLLNI